MAGIGNISSRTTSLLMSDRLLSAIRQTQADLTTAQDQISTGQAVSKPSDAPTSTSAILYLQSQLETRAQRDKDLTFAGGMLDSADAALGNMLDIVRQASSTASGQIGLGSNADTRKNQATVIDGQIQALVDLANQRYQGVALFGGSVTPGTSAGAVFAAYLGGIRYTGATSNLALDVGLDRPLDVNTNGAAAFGGLSSRMQSAVDLDPYATLATRLDETAGALGAGVRRGSVQVTVDGTATVVDLGTADTLGDVVTRINAAIDAVAAGAGSLAVPTDAGGLALTAAAGHTITISDQAGGKTAADLGIAGSAAGATVNGADLAPRLTVLTKLSDLGADIDWTGGLKITQGNQTKVADFSSATTVQDVINIVEGLGLGVRMEINAAGNSLNLVSEVSGAELSIGEVSGGTTATDLGLRTFSGATQLADLNHGLGVNHVAGKPDFAVDLHGGQSFEVNLDGATTVADVVAKVKAAAVAAGLTVGAPGAGGTDFNIGLAADGNGLALEDGTAGGGEFKVRTLGYSTAASDLGILQSAGAGNTVTGTDVALVQSDSMFTHLLNLRDALAGNDERGITLAAGALESDLQNLARVQADLGVRSQRVQQQQSRSDAQKIAEKTALSGLQDTDMAEVITRFTQLQQQLEATLQVGAQNLQLSLLDYLR